MMREVVDNRDAIDHSPHFKPSLHALKTSQRLLNRSHRYTLIRRQRRSRRSIQSVVLPGQRHLQLSPKLPVMMHFPLAAAILMAQLLNAPRRVGAKAISLHTAEGSAHALIDIGAAIVSDNH